MPTVIQSLVDLRPPVRYDTIAWAHARIEWSTEFDGTWAEASTADLVVDTDATLPALRSFSVPVDSTAKWLRVVWVDSDDNELGDEVVLAVGPVAYVPTPEQITVELRAFATDASGNDIGIYTADSGDDHDKTDQLIAEAVRDVSNRIGSWVPGPVIADARRATALAAAAIVVRSALPEQTSDDRSGYQAIQAAAGAALDQLEKRMNAIRMIGLSGSILA